MSRRTMPIPDNLRQIILSTNSLL